MHMFRFRDPFRRAQLAIAVLFCCLGFQYATWASRLPTIKTRLGLTPAAVGLLLLACGIGAAASFPLVTMLMRKWGSRRLGYVSALGLSLLLPALAVAPSYPVGLVIMGADGIAVACLNAAMNAQGATLEARHQRHTMAKLHAAFSGGALLAALLASGLGALTPSLPVHFGVAASLMVLVLVSTRSGLLREDLPAPVRGSRRRLAMPSRLTVWLGCAMAFGTVTEAAMNDWSALYLKDVANAAPELAPIGIAVISVMMVLARLLADGWRARWGDKRVVIAGGALAGSGLAVAVLLGGVAPALAGFACVGLGMAAVTPCVYVAAAAAGPDALTLVAAMGVTGLLAGPPMIGFIANATDLGWGMAAVAACAGLVSVCVTQIRWPSAVSRMESSTKELSTTTGN
jgi:MFS family permease